MYEAESLKPRQDNPFVEKFEAFFKERCIKNIERLANDYPNKTSLLVDFRELEHFDFDLADELLDNPDVCLQAAEKAITNIDVPVLGAGEFAPHIRVFNLPAERQPVLRDLGAEHIGKLISLEGLVRQVTEVLPRLKFATFRCTRCDATYKIPQTKNQPRFPTFCAECKNRTFALDEETSEFVDYQKIQVQEPLEQLKGSDQPTNLDIYLGDDLVNKISPGDRARVTGIMRLSPPKEKKVVYGRYFEAVYVEETKKEFEEVEITKEEEEEIRKLAARDDIYELLTQSIAPHIYGHETVKEAIALQLFGGVKKTLPNEQYIRGNAHILLVGDPGLAKSQLLKATHSIAPKSVYVAGKTTSGAGITATAVKDDFGEGGWTIKAGALVLASGGMAMVDEFDKMECLTREALVCMEDGKLLPIGEVFKKAKASGKLIEHEKGRSVKDVQGMACLSMDEKNGKIVKRRILAAHEYDYGGRLLEIRLQSGEKIKVTPNHPFFTVFNGNMNTIKAGKLEKGVFVAVPSSLPNEDGEKNTELAKVYGYLAGDGNVTYNPLENYLIRFTNKNNELLEDFDDCCAKTFGKGTIYPSDARADGVSTVRLNGKRIVDFIADNAPGLMEKYSEKYTPALAFQDTGNGLGYLRALFDSEGSVDPTRKQVSFASTSLRLANEVKTLLLKSSILSQIREKEPKSNRRKAYRLLITDRNSIERFYTRIGFESTQKMEKLAKIVSKEPQRERTVLNVIPHIGKLLREVRLGLGLKQEECGINKVTYNNFENDKANISIKKASKVLSAFKNAKANRLFMLEIDEKIRLIESLVNSDVLFRKTKSIREIWAEGEERITYKLVHSLNNALKEIGMKGVPFKKAQADFEKIIAEIEKALTGIEGACGKPGSIEEAGKLCEKYAVSQGSIAASMNTNQSAVSRMLDGKIKCSNEKEGEFINSVKKILTGKKGMLQTFLQEAKENYYNPPNHTKIYDLTIEESHNFIANNIIVHNSEDRSAMHESLEDQRVSVAKAGIVATFKTETSVLAAANPKYSRFDPYQPFIEQIDLPPSLISRFDLFFMIRDVLDRTKDTEIAMHILKSHRVGEMMMERKSKGITKKNREVEELEEQITPKIPGEMLKKYISYARQHVFPVLTDDSVKQLSEYYVSLRDQGRREGAYSATHRQLEGLIRLTEASARVRLSSEVERHDVERAIRLLRTSLQDLVTDPETGKIDIDIITSGQTHTMLSNMKKILSFIKEKAQEVDMVPLEDVMDEGKTIGMDAEKVREVLDKLDKSGDIYRPRHGFLKPTSAKGREK